MGQSIKTHITYKSLKCYLKEVSSLEVQAFNQSRLLSSLASQANMLGRASNIFTPQKPRFSAETYSSFGNYWRIGCIIIAISILFMAGLVTMVGVTQDSDRYILYLLFLAGIIFILLSFIPGLLAYLIDKRKYAKSMERYSHSLSVDSARIQQELPIKKEIERQIGCVRNELARTKASLQTLYSLGILHKDYQYNLIAVCSFYDYLDKGICTTLTGHEGAYKFYEEDLRFRRIETRLDVVIDKLDVIISNQYQLASLIREGNAAISRIEKINNNMESQLAAIQRNTAVAEYNSRCAAQSASVLENIAIYRTLRDY